MLCRRRRKQPLPLGAYHLTAGVPWRQLRSLGSGMSRCSCGNGKVRRDLLPGTVWLLSQDRKSPRLEPWGMKALGRRARAGLEAKAAFPDLAWAGPMVGTGEI